MILLRSATITVASLERSIELYTRWLGYQLVEQGEISSDLANSWGATDSSGQAYAVLQPSSGKEIFLRLVQQDPVAGFKALRTFGWNAIEVCVSDVSAVNEQLKASPFEIIGPPRANAGLANIHPMQVKGPDEEVFFLTQINSDVAPFRLPRAASLIDQIFIMVIGCSDMKAGTDWFERHLGFSVGEKMQIAYTMLSKAYGQDMSTQFGLTTMMHEYDVFVEVDQYPDEAVPRPGREGELAPGIAMTTFITPDWDKLVGPWVSAPQVRQGCIYSGKRAGTMKGPDGALVEVVEL